MCGSARMHLLYRDRRATMPWSNFSDERISSAQDARATGQWPGYYSIFSMSRLSVRTAIYRSRPPLDPCLDTPARHAWSCPIEKTLMSCDALVEKDLSLPQVYLSSVQAVLLHMWR